MNNARLGRSVLLTVAGQLALPVSTFATAPVLAHALGVVGRGEFAAATAPFLFFATFATFGITEAVTVSSAQSPRSSLLATRNGLLILLGTGVLSAALTVLLSTPLAGGDASLARIIALVGLAIPIAVLVGGLRGLAQGLNRWGAVAVERSITAAARIVAIFTLFFMDALTVERAAGIIALSPALSFVAYVSVLRESRRLRSSVKPAPPAVTDGASVRGLSHFGARQWIGSVSGILLSRLDQLLLTPLAGAFQLGIYSVAVNIADVTLLINHAVRDVVMSSDAAERSNTRLTKAARLSLLMSLGIGLVICVSVPFWLPILFGSDFAPATTGTIILIIASVLGVPGSVAGAGLAARGKPELRSLAILVALGVNVILLLVLAPWLGANGAALATLAGNVIAANLNIVFCRRLYGIHVLAFYRIRRQDIRDMFVTIRSSLAHGDS